jgi:hypothetical protein
MLLSEEGAGPYIRTDVLVDTDRPEIKTADWEMGGLQRAPPRRLPGKEWSCKSM